MRRLFIHIVAMLAVIVPSLALVAPAEAASNRTPNCVTKAEFRKITKHQSPDKVRKIIGNRGKVVYENRVWIDGYWEGDFVEDRYWNSFDWDGNGVITPDEGEWIDTSYWDDYANWIPGYSLSDTIRSYKRCSSWGGGRAAVWFDNYTSHRSGMRVYTKYRTDPFGGQRYRSTARVADVLNLDEKRAEHTRR